jgi:hypothetical protein
MIAEGGVPTSLLARFPALPHGVWIGVKETLGLQRLGLAIHLDAVMARASVEPFARPRIHALCDIRYGNAEFAVVERERWRRYERECDGDGEGASAHEDTADPHQPEREYPGSNLPRDVPFTSRRDGPLANGP